MVASRNALEPGSGQQAVPVRATLLGSIAAVTAVIVAVVFGTSLTGLITHPARYGWNWQILIQAEGGYGNFTPGVMNRLVGGQPAVAAWSSFGFSQLMIDGRVVPALGLQRERGSAQPPTTSGQPVSGNGQIELGSVTLHQLGQQIGGTVLVGTPALPAPAHHRGHGNAALVRRGGLPARLARPGRDALRAGPAGGPGPDRERAAGTEPEPRRPPRQRWPSTWSPAPAPRSGPGWCT